MIGITTYLEVARWGTWELRAALLPEWYVDAVRAVGGRPVLLPPDDVDADVLGRLDGLIIAGGPDIAAERYGEVPHPAADEPRASRDASELLLFRSAIAHDLPVLGICRGLQVMAVASGGSLVQDLPDCGYGSAHRERPGTFQEHEVTVHAGSRLAEITGSTTLRVNSSHHQGVADPGTLLPTAWAPDGLIEACEIPASNFVLGVQWHPERPDDSDGSNEIFRALVEAASRT